MLFFNSCVGKKHRTSSNDERINKKLLHIRKGSINWDFWTIDNMGRGHYIALCIQSHIGEFLEGGPY